jgi:hypothetical protein
MKDYWIKHPKVKLEKFKKQGTKQKVDKLIDELDAK